MDTPVFHTVLVGRPASGKTHRLRELITAELSRIETTGIGSVWAASPYLSGLAVPGFAPSEAGPDEHGRWLTHDVDAVLRHAHERALGTAAAAEQPSGPLLVVLDDVKLPENSWGCFWLTEIWHAGLPGVRLAISAQTLQQFPPKISQHLDTYAEVVKLPNRRGAHVPTLEGV
jgi:hypothetical protein